MVNFHIVYHFIIIFNSSDNASGTNADSLSITGQNQPSDQSNTGTKRSFAESNENAEKSTAVSTGSDTGVDEESRRKKRKDESGKEGKSIPQRSIGKHWFNVPLFIYSV